MPAAGFSPGGQRFTPSRSATFWGACIPAAVALALSAYTLSLPNVLFGIHSYTGDGYDDGVYLGAALRLAHGVVPYRDFVFTQPPGLVLLFAPVGLLAGLIGNGDAMALARIVTACVVGANAALAALAVRTRGLPAMLIAGVALACFPLATAATHTLLLEPYLTLFSLLGVVVAFSFGALTPKRLFAAGVLLGFATSVKIWGALVALPFLACALPQWRRLRAGLAGLVLGFVGACGFFFVDAPRSFVHDVVLDQLGRNDVLDRLSFGQRMAMMTGIGGLDNLSRAGLAETLVLIGAVVTLVVYILDRKAMRRVEWFILAATVVVLIEMCLSAEFYDHYAYFPAAFLAMLLGVVGVHAFSLLGRMADRLVTPGRRTRIMVGGGLALVLVVAVALGIPHVLTYSRDYVAHGYDPSATIEATMASGSCSVADDPILLVLADRFTPSTDGCSAIVDPFGMFLAEDDDTPPPGVQPFPAPFVAQWQAAFAVAQYVVLSVPQSDYVPWTPALTAYFNSNFTLVKAVPHVYIYLRNSVAADVVAPSVTAGLAALNIGRVDLAAEDFAGALRADPRNPTAAFDLGVAEGLLGDAQGARAAYERAIAADPNDVLALYNLAILLTPSEPATAISLYSRAVKVDPKDANARFNLGLLLVGRGEVGAGDAELQRAIALSPALRARLPASIHLP